MGLFILDVNKVIIAASCGTTADEHIPLPRPASRSSFVLSRREYQRLLQEQRPSANASSLASQKPAEVSLNSPTAPERELSTREQRRNDWAIINFSFTFGGKMVGASEEG